MCWDLPPHTGALVDVHKVRLGLSVDSELSFRPNNLRGIVLPGRHHPATVKIRNLSAIKFHNAHSIVAIVVLSEFGLNGGDAGRNDRFYERVLPEEPQGEVDVVDGAVDEDPARELRVCDKEPRGVELVACLRAEDGGAAYEARVHFVVGVAVGIVEAAGETAHYFEMGLLLCGVDY